MERTAVDSNNIASVGHDEDSQTLEVEFTNGSVYQYFDVPRHIFEAFLVAGSPGQFLASTIKGNYRFSRT